MDLGNYAINGDAVFTPLWHKHLRVSPPCCRCQIQPLDQGIFSISVVSATDSRFLKTKVAVKG